MLTPNNKMILSNGRFSGTSRQELTGAFDALAASPNTAALVIHFHGGLVSQTAGEEIAERLFPVYQGASGYPFFVIWQTGLLETIRNNWRELVQESAVSLLVEKVMQFVLGKLDQAPGQKGSQIELPSSLEVRSVIETEQSAGAVPYAERDAEAKNLDSTLLSVEQAQFESLLQQDAAFQLASAALSRPDGPELSPDLDAELEAARAEAEPGAKGLISTAALVAAGVRILGRALKRFSSQRDHGVYTTVVEEVARELKGDLIGRTVWSLMKKDAQDAFAGDGAMLGGTALLDEIKRIWQAGHRPRLVLVGHSAGSIYICHLLKAAAEKLPPEIRFEAIFLAPGCSFQLFDQVLAQAGDRVAAFRSFGMQDALELRDAILPPLYLCSLLYCVSGLLEETVDLPLVGMQRYHSQALPFDPAGFPEIKRVRDRLAAFSQPWIWSDSTAGPGLSTLARSHGAFDNEAQTLESLAVLIRQGGF